MNLHPGLLRLSRAVGWALVPLWTGQGVGLVHPLETWSGLVWWKEEQKLRMWSQGFGDRVAKFGASHQSGEGER